MEEKCTEKAVAHLLLVGGLRKDSIPQGVSQRMAGIVDLQYHHLASSLISYFCRITPALELHPLRSLIPPGAGVCSSFFRDEKLKECPGPEDYMQGTVKLGKW